MLKSEIFTNGPKKGRDGKLKYLLFNKLIKEWKIMFDMSKLKKILR
jgi:hypothetical protein